MTELENAKYIPKAVFRPLSRFLVVLFAATMSLSLTTTVLAQQSAEPGQQTQGAIKTRGAKPDLKNKENTMNQPLRGRPPRTQSVPFMSPFRKQRLTTCADVSPPHAGRNRKRSPINRKASSWRR
jgi:hypothetical protein